MSDTYVAKPDMKVLLCLSGLAAHHGKTWCFPSQEKILELLAFKYQRVMSRRALNNHLGALAKLGYIERVRRHKTSPSGSLELHSSLYKIKARAAQFIGLMVKSINVLAAHPWSSRWISAVKKAAQSDDLQSNIIGGLPKNQADPP